MDHSLIAFWTDKKWSWEYAAAINFNGKEIAAASEQEIHKHAAEGIQLPGWIAFNNPHMGVRFQLDDLDTANTFSVFNLNRDGITQPADLVHVSVYDAVNSIYAIQINHSLPFKRYYRLLLFNSDEDQHNALRYYLPYVRLPRRK